MADKFSGSFTQQEPIPEAAIEAAVRVLRSGRLHRYNLSEGEAGEVASLEREMRDLTGAKYALAVTSGGYALATALRAHGVKAGDEVLTNAFTLAPVPGAIASVGAKPIFVETTETLTIDFEHLERTASASGAKVLMLSHMRGHQPDMDEVLQIAKSHGVIVIEDCAHTMGGTWDGVVSGRHGASACYSTQTYKHINSGEGGILITDDAEVAARATLLSGSYMLYDRHGAGPSREVYEPLRDQTPNVSGRMDHLRAAILRPQLADLSKQVERWSALHAAMEEHLGNLSDLKLIGRDPRLGRVGSSFQFRLPSYDGTEIMDFVARCAERGVELKWFGGRRAVGFTSNYRNWEYAEPPELPQTDQVMASLIDMRLPLTFSVEDCATIASIIRSEVSGGA